MTLKHIVVQAHDKNNPDSIELDARNYKAGDVIVVLPEDHKFTERELTNPDWRIYLTDAPDEFFDTIQKPESPDGNPNWQKRQRRINFSANGISQAAKDLFADDTRAVKVVRDDELLYEQKVKDTRAFETEQEFAARKVTWGGK